MTGDNGDAGRETAMRDGNARTGGDGKCRRDARHHVVRDAGRSQRLNFLPTSSKQKRVTALQAHDVPPLERMLDQHRLNIAL